MTTRQKLERIERMQSEFHAATRQPWECRALPEGWRTDPRFAGQQHSYMTYEGEQLVIWLDEVDCRL